LSTEAEDNEEEIIDSSDEVMEEQGIQGTRGQALTGARDPLVGIRILTSQANADAGGGSSGSSDDEPMEDQGTFQHSTTLADGTVTSTRVSSRIMKSSNMISKRRKMELNQTDDFDPAPEDDLSVVMAWALIHLDCGGPTIHLALKVLPIFCPESQRVAM
jgi:hypothetical protein